MAKVVLHIGPHKTGTSYIQRRLFANRARLEQAGLYYPDIGPNPAHHILTAKWIPNPDFDLSLKSHGGIDALWTKIIDTYAPKDGTLILSGEPFTRLEPARVDFKELAGLLSPFEEVRIVYYARDPIALTQSIWQEVAKSGRFPAIQGFVQRAIATGLASGVPVDHNLVLDTLEEGFCPDQITIFDYETVKAQPGGILQALLNVTGSDLMAEGTLKETKQANTSPDPLAQLLATELTAPARPPHAIYDAARRALLDRFDKAPTTIFTPAQIATLKASFVEKNQRFEKRVQQHSPAFSMSPNRIDPQTHVTPRQVGPGVTAAIARQIYQLERIS
ncbi:hypothetical protein [Celeribacter baekdonensis]|uniref:Sulfotransferase domain-containing protein n=1 Tax=Celeribacter baekdonensis B30 TaxID=1208323 RepID=K2JVH5_9RHOB|nr:hypothetical protein [Celeribacter baekdonensis]EKE74309.1 hypothetical protein B30_01245 [Celeribacter baekdonensis B30]